MQEDLPGIDRIYQIRHKTFWRIKLALLIVSFLLFQAEAGCIGIYVAIKSHQMGKDSVAIKNQGIQWEVMAQSYCYDADRMAHVKVKANRRQKIFREE